jgi:hypothetical protein
MHISRGAIVQGDNDHGLRHAGGVAQALTRSSTATCRRTTQVSVVPLREATHKVPLKPQEHGANRHRGQ